MPKTLVPSQTLRNAADLRIGMDHLITKSVEGMQGALESEVIAPILKFLRDRIPEEPGAAGVGRLLNDLPMALDVLNPNAMTLPVETALLHASSLGRIEAEPTEPVVDLDTGSTEPSLLEEEI